MRILVTPDSFKGTMSSQRICDIFEEIAQEISSKLTIVKVPVADGGEGTIDAMVAATGGEIRTRKVTGPLGNPTMARYGVLGDGVTAVMEMAEASGITLVPRHELNPLKASSLGTGELIKDAIDTGCQKIIMGIGGSATNDGGMGMLSALGFQFKNAHGQNLTPCGEALGAITAIQTDTVDPRLSHIQITVACDVDNPLLGERGATQVFGPQKGATPEYLTTLENGMKQYAKVTSLHFGSENSTLPGAGAAGGLGFALISYLGAQLKPGFRLVADALNLDGIIRDGNFQLIVTGEGMMNSQTLSGKLPMGIANLGKKHGVPVVAIVGAAGDGIEPLYKEGLVGVFSTMRAPMNLDQALKQAEGDLRMTVESILRFADALGSL
ncbi:MAG: glycerate kinase [Spirochaetales bacterium]|nr:glycerate kinase [Spirochaetales bacterium]